MMDQELKALIESSEFKRYHKELQDPAFNPFDVLQVAEYEIRHSNVLAWLLRPGETHRNGGRFLRALVQHLTSRWDGPSVSTLKSLPLGFDDENNVTVRREDYHEGIYADITVGFKAERVLLIIENKVGPSSPDAEKQVKLYQDTLSKKYKGQYKQYPGVLLTTSSAPDAGTVKGNIIHVSWKAIGGIIRSLLKDQETFTDTDVHAFVKRYLDVIEEKLVWAGSPVAQGLLVNYDGLFRRLEDQPSLLDGVEDVPHRKTVKQLMDLSHERFAKLREQVDNYLKLERKSSARTLKTKRSWLQWYGLPFGKELNVSESVWWYFSFYPRDVFLELGNWGHKPEEKSSMDRLWEFLQETPIEPDRPDRSARYPMEKDVIYRYILLKDDELSGPFDEVVKLLRRRLDEFFGASGDYQKIERYFRCLAFLAFDPRRLPQPDPGTGRSDLPASASS